MAPVEVVIRNGHVLAVASHVDIPARALGDAAVGQVALEEARAGQGVQVLAGLEGALEPGAHLGDVGEVHAAVGRELVEDHLRPGRAGAGVGHDEDVVRARPEVAEPRGNRFHIRYRRRGLGVLTLRPGPGRVQEEMQVQAVAYRPLRGDPSTLIDHEGEGGLYDPVPP